MSQMTVEEDYLESVIGDVMYYLTQYALGARGIDGIRKYDEINEESWLYPVYDGHGNMIATLSRSGSSFALDNERLYDAWGVVKTGSATGGPTNRYVASIGHQQDDESDLIYMRARYYEPWSGRFLSQDPAMHGSNWYVYCGNEPVNRIDPTGKLWWFYLAMAAVGAFCGILTYVAYEKAKGGTVTASGIVAAALGGAVVGLGGGLLGIAALETVTAAACGDMLVYAIVSGMLGIGIAGVGGGIERGLTDGGFENSPAGKALRSILGAQVLQIALLEEIYAD